MITDFGPQQGWQCPVCKYVYGPTMPVCLNCNRPENEKYKTSTGTEAVQFVHICKNPDTGGKCELCRQLGM